MQTYLNELYYKTDENRNTNMKQLTSLKKGKNIFNINNKKGKNNNNIPQSKSSLFLNNYIRPNKNLINKKESNSIKVVKKRKKNINVNPYQKMGNKYILNYALDNLNKYQENLLIKDNKEDEKNNINNNNFNNKIEYYNNFIINNDSNNLIMNKSLKNFRTSNKNNENNYYNNKKYSEYFVKNDLFMNEKELKNEEIPEPEPYIINKYNTKNKIENSKQINKNKNKTNKNNIDIKLNFTLSNLELNELKNVFEENYIFFEDLFLLTKEDFVEMKIPIGPRNRIIHFIEEFNKIEKQLDFQELKLFIDEYKKAISGKSFYNKKNRLIRNRQN